MCDTNSSSWHDDGFCRQWPSHCPPQKCRQRIQKLWILNIFFTQTNFYSTTLKFIASHFVVCFMLLVYFLICCMKLAIILHWIVFSWILNPLQFQFKVIFRYCVRTCHVTLMMINCEFSDKINPCCFVLYLDIIYQLINFRLLNNYHTPVSTSVHIVLDIWV